MQENKLTDFEQSRRVFLKTTGAVGAAAATGVAAFGGTASAQGGDVIRSIEVTDVGDSLLRVTVILSEVLENVNIDVTANIGDVNAEILNVEDNVILLNVNVLSEQAIEQLTVLLSGVTAAGEEVTDSATTQV